MLDYQVCYNQGISVSYLGYLNMILRYPKYHTETPLSMRLISQMFCFINIYYSY